MKIINFFLKSIVTMVTLIPTAIYIAMSMEALETMSVHGITTGDYVRSVTGIILGVLAIAFLGCLWFKPKKA